MLGDILFDIILLKVCAVLSYYYIGVTWHHKTNVSNNV
jgi:hypothetical protein